MPKRLDQRFSPLAVQLSSQVRNMSFDDIGMMLPVEVVQMFEQLLLRNDGARPMNKVFENPVFRRRKIENPAPAANRLLHSIQFQVRNRQHRVRGTFRAPNEGFNSSQKLAQIKGLAEIVIGSRIQQVHDRLFTFLCGENENGSMKLPPPQVLEDALTTLTGKHQVEHDCVILSLLGKVRPFLSVSRMVDRQSGFPQCRDDVLCQPSLVFDQEYAHDHDNLKIIVSKVP